MRFGITVSVAAEDCARLATIIADRNPPQKHVWRASIVLLTADGFGHDRDHATNGQEQAVRLALAGTIHAGGRRV